MKSLKHILMIAAFALVAASCTKEVKVSVASDEIVVAPEGGTMEVAVASNGEWSVDFGFDWMTVSPMSGKGDATLSLSVTPNEGSESRSGQVTVSSKDNSAIFTVRQEPNALVPFITIEPDTIRSMVQGGTYDIVIKSNVNWEVGTTARWITFSTTSGSGNAQITVTINDMSATTLSQREADVTIGNADVSTILHVVQQQEVPSHLEVSPKEVGVTYLSASSTLTVLCTEQWSAESEEDWIVVQPSSGVGDATVSLAIAENDKIYPRIGRVVFVSQNGMEFFVRVYQDAAPDPHHLVATPLDLTFEGQGGSAAIAVECDTAWRADTPEGWIQLSTTSGMGNGTIQVQVEANALPYERNGKVTLVSDELKVVVNVVQGGSGEPPVIAIEPDTVFIDAEGGTGSFNLTANVPWTLEVDGWINLFQSSGIGDALVSFYVNRNPDPRERIARIVAIYNAQALAQIVVVQAARVSYLQISQNEIIAPKAGGNYSIDITSNQSWMVNKGDTWTPFSPSSGYGNGQLQITVEPYTEVGSRVTEIHVNALESEETFVISIKQRDY